MSPLTVFVIGLVAFLVLVLLGIPVGFAFGLVGFIGVVLIKGSGPGLALMGDAPWRYGSMASMIVIPLFILMGQFVFYSGISRDLYTAAYKWLGHVPGGLALATNLACTGFAAACGSSLASGAAMGTIAYPEMVRFQYAPELATGSICAGGTLGILIPPSVTFIVYGVITQQPIGDLFMAGIFPGLLLSSLFSLVIVVLVKRNPQAGPRGESSSWREKFSSLGGIWPTLILFILVMGGFYLGVFAPSEAGAVAAFGAFVIALFKRTKVSQLTNALIDSLRLTCMILTIVIGAMIFNVFIAVSGVTPLFAAWVSELPLPPILVLILIVVMYIPLGMVMDVMAMILLTIPITFPIVTGLGFDPILFGVLIVLVSEMAMITPPVGMLCYIVSGVTKVPLSKVFRGITPFLFALIGTMAILIAFPEISLFLVKLSHAAR